MESRWRGSSALPELPMIVLETAQAVKFGETIREALGRDPVRPKDLRESRICRNGRGGRRGGGSGQGIIVRHVPARTAESALTPANEVGFARGLRRPLRRGI
jgi:hypothetical protein